MLVFPRLLTLVLTVVSISLIMNSTLSQNFELISVNAMEATHSIPLSSLSPGSFQIASYMFPFMRDLVSATEDNNTHSRISLSADNTSNDSNTWKSISGSWLPIGNNLQAGDKLNTIHNIAVRPLSSPSNNLDITTSFTIRSLDPNTVSYVSIVYSWIDPNNYKYAGVTLPKNGIVAYVDFATVSNGELSWDPSWPGSRIDLDWNPGDPIRMTLSLRNNSQELDVNGIGTLQKDYVDNNVSKIIGLSYGRVQDVVFHQFDVQER